MVADSALESADTPVKRRRRGLPRRRSLEAHRLFAFLVAAVLLLVYALRGGGSYDVAVFEQHGLVVWLLLAVGLASGVLPRSRASPLQLLLLGGLLAYAAWTALSLTWTSSSELTFQEIARSLDYLGLVALLGAIFDRDTWRSAAAGVGAAALAVCIVAVGSRLDPSVFGHDQVDAVLHIDRLSVPFGYWNAVGAWGAMCTAIGLAWSAHDPVPWRRAIFLALVPVAVLTTYLTYSRAGVGGVALAVIAVLCFSRSRLTALVHTVVAAGGAALAILAVRGAPEIAKGTGTHGASAVVGALVFAAAACIVVTLVSARLRLDARHVPRKLGRRLATVAGLVALAGAAAFGPHLASQAWHSFTHNPTLASSNNVTARLTSLSGTRYPVWKQALKAFRVHPAGGSGAGTFQFWWNQHATDYESLRDAHNIWLQNLAELGVPGLLLILAVTASAIGVALAVRRRARRTASAGVASAFGAALIVYLLHASFDWMWESTAVTVLALAGVAIIGVRLSGERCRLGHLARALLVSAAVLAAIVQLPGMLSTTDIRNSQSAARSGNAALALSWAQDAISAEPWSATAYQQRGLVFEATGRLNEAARDLRRAISEASLNYANWLILARIETESGKLSLAQRDYDRSRALAPRAAVFALGPYFVGVPKNY